MTSLNTEDKGNYEQKWERLRREIDYLQQREVNAIHPALLDSYMDYIGKVVDYQERENEREQTDPIR